MEDILKDNGGNFNGQLSFRAAIENAPLMIWGTDQAGNIIYFNRKAEELLGYKAEEILGEKSSLLRFLEEGVFRPLGSNREVKVNVRIIAATNRNLEEDVVGGKFREDLYYRLNVLSIELPPLREREDDIPELANFHLSFHILLIDCCLKLIVLDFW